MASGVGVNRDPSKRPGRYIPQDHGDPLKRVPQLAVGWMLGPELIANLRMILRRKSGRPDPRTWMVPHAGMVHDECLKRDGHLIDLRRHARNPGPATLSEHALAPDTEVWFDYIADIGDSSDAMYATAYACQVDLQLELPPGEPLPTAQLGREACGLHVQGTHATDHGRGNLPRGQFLFVGGDTAYHVADEITVRNRVARPFNWAYHDLAKCPWSHDATKKLLPDAPKSRIYGLPGNHDWYNDLHGFSLMFLGLKQPMIALEGFEPRQLASYVAIQLPHDWQLWGLDIDQGLDDRQESYFKSLLPGSSEHTHRDPQRLILCTPSPPVVFHKAIPPAEHDDALRRLHLTQAYKCPPAGTTTSEACKLPKGVCRLDLSGDTHHYARYRWPEAGQDSSTAPYMAVVSGLGGAFHHPSFTRAGTFEPVAEYPHPKASLDAVAPALLHWKSLISGSWIRAFPLLFGLVLAFGSIDNRGAEWLLGLVLSIVSALELPGGGSVGDLGRSLLLLGVLVIGGGLIAASVSLFRSSYDHSLKRAIADLPPRFSLGTTYATCMIAAIAGLAALFTFHLCKLFPDEHGVLDVAVVVIILLATLGGFVLASGHGAEHLTRSRKAALGFLGVVHGIAQIATPLICARLIRLNAMTVVIMITFAAWWYVVRSPDNPTRRAPIMVSIGGLAIAVAAQLILRPPSPTPLAAGLVIVATWFLLFFTRRLFRQQLRYVLLIVVVWLVAWLGGIAALTWAAHGDLAVYRDAPLYNLVQFTVGAIMAVPLSTSYFAWYLAIAGLLDGHNNEVGGAARVTQFRQIIRFHLNPKGLTGYVISIENKAGTENDSPARMQGKNLEFKLIDVFTIAPSAVDRPAVSEPPG